MAYFTYTAQYYSNLNLFIFKYIIIQLQTCWEMRMGMRLGNKAEGADFFDRVIERKDLWSYLESNHIALSGPRRLGKTSLLQRLADEAAEKGFIFGFSGKVDYARCCRGGKPAWLVAQLAAFVRGDVPLHFFWLHWLELPVGAASAHYAP
ncbi:MAG: hypothetical protein WAT67_05650 [Candidatus Contendobacter sp.]